MASESLISVSQLRDYVHHLHAQHAEHTDGPTTEAAAAEDDADEVKARCPGSARRGARPSSAADSLRRLSDPGSPGNGADRRMEDLVRLQRLRGRLSDATRSGTTNGASTPRAATSARARVAGASASSIVSPPSSVRRGALAARRTSELSASASAARRALDARGRTPSAARPSLPAKAAAATSSALAAGAAVRSAATTAARRRVSLPIGSRTPSAAARPEPRAGGSRDASTAAARVPRVASAADAPPAERGAGAVERRAAAKRVGSAPSPRGVPLAAPSAPAARAPPARPATADGGSAGAGARPASSARLAALERENEALRALLRKNGVSARALALALGGAPARGAPTPRAGAGGDGVVEATSLMGALRAQLAESNGVRERQERYIKILTDELATLAASAAQVQF